MSKSLTSSWERKCRNHQKSQAIKNVFIEREVGLRCMFVGVTGTCDPTKQGSFVTGAWGQGRVQVWSLLAWQTVWYNLSHHTADGWDHIINHGMIYFYRTVVQEFVHQQCYLTYIASMINWRACWCVRAWAYDSWLHLCCMNHSLSTLADLAAFWYLIDFGSRLGTRSVDLPNAKIKRPHGPMVPR